MPAVPPTRFPLLPQILICGALLLLGSSAAAQANPAPIERRAAPPPAPVQRRTPSTGKNGGTGKLQGEHLADWLDRHNTETTAQKLQSLEKEPGFHDLPAATQQRMRDRLMQLESMAPDRRRRIISRTEAMEKLTPEQRGQVRAVLGQVAALPPASRKAVQRTFRTVHEMPADQRQPYLNSPDIRSQFTDQERDILQRLMAIEPLLPPGTAVTPQP